MSELWLGAPAEIAEYVFLLPNKPILPKKNDVPILKSNDVPLLIELNGNHWRKIFTIMAKLVASNFDAWRDVRDGDLLSNVGVVFSAQQLHDYQGIVFIVGNTFREEYPIPDVMEVIGNKQLAYISFPYIWCPYLDYRQFPNVLIESLREYLLEK